MRFERGMLLADARLATMGGRSFAFHDLAGRKMLVYGWASWSPSRDALSILQRFYEARRSSLELVTVAFDVTGPAAAMQCLKSAGANHTILIDATCTLTRRWGVRSIPFLFVLDESGVVVHADEKFDDRRIVAALAERATGAPKSLPELPPDELQRLYSVEVLMQACANFLGRKRQADALDSLKKALALDPQNEIIREQLCGLESR